MYSVGMCVRCLYLASEYWHAWLMLECHSDSAIVKCVVVRPLHRKPQLTDIDRFGGAHAKSIDNIISPLILNVFSTKRMPIYLLRPDR